MTIRRSILTDLLQFWLECGWSYVRPDFDMPNHSLIEWRSTDIPAYPRVSHETVATAKPDN